MFEVTKFYNSICPYQLVETIMYEYTLTINRSAASIYSM